MDVTLPSGVVIRGVPDGTTKDQIKAKAISSGLAKESDFSSSVASQNDTNDPGVPLVPGMEGYEQQQAAINKQYADYNAANPEPSLADKGIAALKAGGVMLGNLVPSTIGAIGGSAYGLSQEMRGMDGSQEMARGAEQFSPLSTKDPLANQYMQKAGEVLGALDPGYAAAVGGTGLTAPPIVKNLAQRVISETKANIEAAANYGKSPIEVAQNKTDLIKSQLEAGKTTNELAAKAIENGKVVNNPIAKKVIDQGFDEGVVSAVNAASPQDKSQFLKMVRISEQGKKDARYGSENRPSDVIGESLDRRIKALHDTNRKAGDEIEIAANKIKGKPVNYAPAMAEFNNQLEKAGVTVEPNGKLNFVDSDLEFSSGDKQLVTNIYNKAQRLDGSDAYRVHRLKRLIDRTVDFGKSKQTGVTSGGEGIVKAFRKAVDSGLDNEFPEYNAANTKYSDTIGELNDFQKAAGPSIDLFSENADKSLGTKSRTLLSNAQNRIKLMDSLKSIDAVAKKYGYDFNDDIITQVMFANALDDRFGASAKTSLRGDVEAATGNAFERSLRGDTTLTGLGIETGKAIKKKLTGVNDANTYKALKELLMRKEKK